MIQISTALDERVTELLIDFRHLIAFNDCLKVKLMEYAQYYDAHGAEAAMGSSSNILDMFQAVSEWETGFDDLKARIDRVSLLAYEIVGSIYVN